MGEYRSDSWGLPERLRKLRKRKGVSQIVLGECCGLSKNVIHLYEMGHCIPSVANLICLADYFDVSVDFLLGRE